MLKEAIYHQTAKPYLYVYEKNVVHIRIRTKKEDVKHIHIFYKDPFAYGDIGVSEQKKTMKKMSSCSMFDYWLVEVDSSLLKRMEYFFELQNEKEILFYSENGFFEKKDHTHGYFKFPYIHWNEFESVPKWVSETIWYQIFPERFHNGNVKNNPSRIEEWETGLPSCENFFGGDIEGIITKLDYLQDLGVNGIYLTPIFQASSNHKYDTIDYLEIDKHFGDKETFKRFIQECHKRNIKVMLDAVFNHCGYYFEPFQDVLKKGKISKYKDWFHIHNFPIQSKPKPNYETFAFEPTMPKFNTFCEEVKEYLLEVATYWIREFDIDGWRLDVANEVDATFWREFRTRVKHIKPSLYIVGEVWHHSMPWLQGDQFDAVMNYPLGQKILGLIAHENISLQQFQEDIQKLQFEYPQQNVEANFNLLGSHDTTRILNQTNFSIPKTKLLFLLLLTFTGSPCIYYGDEIGLDGWHDPDCRKPMVWDKKKQNQDLLSFVKEMIQLRKERKSFQKGFVIFYNQNELLFFEKEFEDEKSIIAINTTKEIKVFHYTDGSILSTNASNMEKHTYFLQPYEYVILHYKKQH